MLLSCHPAGRNKIQDRHGPDVFAILSVTPQEGSAYLVRNEISGEQRYVSASEIRRYVRPSRDSQTQRSDEVDQHQQQQPEGPQPSRSRRGAKCVLQLAMVLEDIVARDPNTRHDFTWTSSSTSGFSRSIDIFA